MNLELFTKNSLQTRSAGKLFGGELLKLPREKKALIIGLEGDLGGGKTTFVQGLAQGLGIKERIQSPTFVLIKRFRIPKARFSDFYHFDCYRLKGPREALTLNLKGLFSNPANILVIEWADKIRKVLPKKSVWINFEFIDKQKRKITFN